MFWRRQNEMGVGMVRLWMTHEWCSILLPGANRVVHILANEATKLIINRTWWDDIITGKTRANCTVLILLMRSLRYLLKKKKRLLFYFS